MADARADIIIDVDTSVGIAEIKNLQRQIAQLNAQLLQSGAQQARAAQNIQRNLINNINATGQFSARVKTITSTTESFTRALETNKMSMGQYFKYAGGASKTFGKLFKSEFDTIQKVAESRVKTLQTQFVKLGRDANGAMKAIAVRPLALDMENLATKTAIAAQKQQLFNQLMKQGSTNLLNFGKNTQWAGRQLMVGFSVPLAYLGTVASKTFMKMEEQAIRFKRVYGDSFTASSETDKMIKQVQQLAGEFTKYGVQVEKTMEMAANAAAMGKMGADLLAQINQATRLAVLGGVEQEQALETTISLTNAFGIAAEDLSKKINFLNAVENQTVTAIEDLTIAIPKAAPVIKQLGGNVEDLAFFLTAMKEGGINASEGANALKSGLASLINPTAKASEFLQGFGVNLNAIVEANKGDVKGLVLDFAQALDTLDPLNRARAIEQLFGKFQFSRLSTLFQNVIAEGSQANRVLKLTRNSTEELAILSERELKRVEDSPMYKFKKAVEDLKVSLVPLGEAFLKAITPLVEFAKGFLDKFNSMGEGAKNFAVIATTVVAGIGPVLLMTFGLIANGVANLIKMFSFIGKTMSGAGKSSMDLGAQTDYMTQQQLEAAAVASSLDQKHAKLIQTFNLEAGAVNNLAVAYGRAVVNQSRLLGVNPETGMPVAKGAKVPRPKKYNSGVLSVPGPKGAGDIVPAMLSPGEAIIPAKQSKKYSDLIQAMISDSVPGFRFGRLGAALGGFNPFASMLGRSRVAVRTKQEDLMQMLQAGKNGRYKSAFETGTGADFLDIVKNRNTSQEFLRKKMEQKVFGLGPDAPASARPTYGYARTSPVQALINKLFGFKGKQYNAVTTDFTIGDRGKQYGYKDPKTGMFGPTPNFKSDTLDRYGDIDLVTKRSVARRSSAAVSDALMDFNKWGHSPSFKLSPLAMRNGKGNPKDAFFDRLSNPFGRYQSDPIKYPNQWTANPKPPYVETYTPGGFSVKEISKIITKDRSTAKALQKVVDKAGLRIRVTPQNAPVVVRALSNIFGTRFSKGTTGVKSQAQLEDAARADLKSKLRGIPSPSFRDEYNSLVDLSAFDSETEFIKKLAQEEGIKNADKLRGLSGMDLSHLTKSTRQTMIGAELYETKNWEYSNVRADRGLVNQTMENISKLGTPRGSFLNSISVTDFQKATGLSLSQAKRELTNLRNGVHPSTRQAYTALQGLANITSQAFPSKATGKDARMLSKFIDYRFENKKYFDAMESGALIAKASGAKEAKLRLTEAKGRESQDRRINAFNEKFYATSKPTRNPSANKPIPKPAPRASKVPSKKPAQTFSLSKIAGRGGGSAFALMGLLGLGGSLLSSLKQNQYANGVISVPGPKGAGDVVPAMLSPGEAVIPAKESKKYAPLISSMINDSVPGYASGRVGAATGAGGVGFSDRAAEIIGKGLGQVLGRSRILARSIGSAVSSGIQNSPSLAKAVSRLNGGTATVVTPNGREFNSGAEVRTDKRGNQYYVDPGKGRISKEEFEARQASNSKSKLSSRIGARMGGGLGTVASVGSSVGMGLMMSGQQELGTGVMVASMLAPMLPMLMNPIGLAVAGFTALAAGAFFLNEQYKKNVKESYDLAMATSASSKAIRQLAEFSGNVSAGEIMDKRRAAGVDVFQIAAGKTGFGQAFLQSEAGKSLQGSIAQAMEQQGRDAAKTSLANQMATAVASGALDAGQARDIVAALGAQLNDYNFSISVNSKLLSLLGPNGENLLTDPLSIRTKIIDESRASVEAIFPDISSAAAASNQSGTVKAAEGNNIFTWLKENDTFGLTNLFANVTTDEDSAAKIGQFTALASVALQTQQEMQDSLTIQYEQLIANAEAEGDLVKAAKLRKEFEEQNAKLLEKNAEVTKSIQTEFASADAKTQGQILENFRTMTEEMYKDDPISKAILTGMESKLDALTDDKEVIIRASLLSGDLSVTAANNLLNGENSQKEVELLIKLGGAGYNKADQIAGLFGDGTVEVETKAATGRGQGRFTTTTTTQSSSQYFKDQLASMSPADAATYMSSFDSVIQSFSSLPGNGLEVGMNFYLENPELLDKANKDIADFKKKTEGKPITLDIIQEVYGQEMVDKIVDNQEYFDSLPDDQKITYTTVLKMIGEMDPTAKRIEAINFAKSGEGAKYFKKMYGTTYDEFTKKGYGDGGAMAEKVFDTYYAESVTETSKTEDDGKGDPKDKGDGGSKPNDPYKPYLERLKQFRNAAVKVTDDLKKNQAEFNKVLADGTATVSKFAGSDRKLLFKGYSTDFIDAVNGMDEATKKRFVSIKNGIVTVTDEGKKLQKAISEIKLGEFSFSLVSGVAAINKQKTAMAALTEEGMSSADAFEVVQDESLAYAIATAATTEEVRQLVEESKKLKKAQQELAFTTPEGTQAWLDEYSGKVSAVTSKVNQWFEAQKTVVNQDFESGTNKSGKNSGLLNIEKLSDTLEAAGKIMAEYQYQMDDLQYNLSTIEDQEDAVNKKYDERAEALNRIWEANSDIAEQQKAQLDIAQALASGDIAAAARAMQEEQRRRAQKAKEDQEKALDMARENELESLKSNNNKTRKQLEDEILQLSKKMTTLEEEKIEPNERLLRLAEDQRKIALEAVGKEGYLGQTEDAWKRIEAAARLATVQSEAFKQSLQSLALAVPGFSIVLDKDGKPTIAFDDNKFAADIPKPGLVLSETETPQPAPAPGSAPGSAPEDKPEDKPKLTAEQQAMIDRVIANRAIVTAEKKITSSDRVLMSENIKLIQTLDKLGIDKSLYRLASGGMVPKYFAAGGFASGTDTIPAMLTPGEFVMSRYAVRQYGTDTMKAINSGTYKGDSMYNYEVNVNVKSDANPDQIARAVMTQIKQIDSQRIRSNRY